MYIPYKAGKSFALKKCSFFVVKIYFPIIIFLLIYSLTAASQTQMLWSTNPGFDEDDFNQNQYESPIWSEYYSSFFNYEEIKLSNDWIGANNPLVRDFNNDGYSDLFVSFYSSEQEKVPFKLFLYNPISGLLEEESQLIQNNIGQSFSRKSIAADFNGDGILDIVLVSHPEIYEMDYSYLDIVLSNPNGWEQKTLSNPRVSLSEGYYHGIAVGDVDNDIDIDFVIANAHTEDGMITYLNDGEGNFATLQSVAPNGQYAFNEAFTNELSDINNDGRLDLFYWRDDNAQIAYGNGDGTFGPPFQKLDYGATNYFYDFDILDIDNDGDKDLVLLENDENNPGNIKWSILFLKNIGLDQEGKVIFEDISESVNDDLKSQGFYLDESSSTWCALIQFIDINNDGIKDIIKTDPFEGDHTINMYHLKWVLFGKEGLKYEYHNYPVLSDLKNLNAMQTESGVDISWETFHLQNVNNPFSYEMEMENLRGEVEEWIIYYSESQWGDKGLDRVRKLEFPYEEVKRDTIGANCFRYRINFDVEFKENTDVYARIAYIDTNNVENPVSSEVSFFVEGNGINKTPIDISLKKPSVKENTIANSFVSLICAYDEDINDTHTYALVNGEGDEHNSCFYITNDSLFCKTIITNEVGFDFNLRIQATDNDGAVFEKALIVSVVTSAIETWDVTNFLIEKKSINLDSALYRGLLIDINKDGLKDMICTQQDFENEELRDWIVFKNMGNGNFNPVNNLLEDDTIKFHIARDFIVADFNNDNQEDVLFAGHGPDSPETAAKFGSGEQSQLWLQTGSGKLENITSINLPQQKGLTHSIAAGDIDNDGDLDIFLGNSPTHEEDGFVEPRFHINDGNGFFTDSAGLIPAEIENLECNYLDWAFIDVNKDGFLDIIGGRGDGAHETQEKDVLLLNDGDLNFNYSSTNALPVRGGGLNWGTQEFIVSDFNGDGYSDIIASSYTQLNGAKDAQLCYWENTKDGKFIDVSMKIEESQYLEEGEEWYVWFYPVDLNNDGWMDLCAAADFMPPRIYLNHGNGNLKLVKGISERFSYVSEILPSDLDRDGDMDLIFLTGESEISITWNKNNFSVDTSPLPKPEPPTLVSPVSDEVVSKSPVFKWNPNGATVTVQIQVALDEEFTNLVYNNLNITAHNAFKIDITEENNFYWRIRGTNTAGTGEWSEIESFVVNTNNPPTNISLSNSNIDENLDTGTFVGILSTEDEDMNDSHTYSLVNGEGDSDNSSFQIVKDSLISNETFDYETQSLYHVRIQSKDSEGAYFSKSFKIQINDLTENVGVKKLSDSEIAVYPNPITDNRLLIDHDKNKPLFLSIFDLSGKKVLSKTIHKKQISLNLEFLKSGMYIIMIQSENKVISLNKLIK